METENGKPYKPNYRSAQCCGTCVYLIAETNWEFDDTHYCAFGQHIPDPVADTEGWAGFLSTRNNDNEWYGNPDSPVALWDVCDNYERRHGYARTM